MTGMATITRAQAGLPPTPAPAVARSRKTRLFLHHTVTPQWTGVQAARNLWAIARARGFIDTSYPWLADVAGNEVEGRGWERLGGHTRGFNTTSEAISLVGNYDVVPPPPAMVAAAARLAAQTLPGRVTDTHSDVAATACPGRYGRAAVPAINTPTPDDVPTVEDDVRYRLVKDRTGPRVYKTGLFGLVAERGTPHLYAYGRDTTHVGSPGVAGQYRDAGMLASPDVPDLDAATIAVMLTGPAFHVGPNTLADLRAAGLIVTVGIPAVDPPTINDLLGRNPR